MSRASFEAARAAFEEGDYQRAIDVLDRFPFETQENHAVARLAMSCYSRLGETSLALGEVTRLRRLEDTDALRRQARRLLSSLRETDPAWLPSVSNQTQSRASSRTARLMHLLKESLPYSQSGYTLRSRATLEAQRRAGFDPVVITSLGFPAYKGIENAPHVETVEGVRHHRLSVPANFSAPVKDLPFDIVLNEQAAQTARICGDEQPRLIQAASGFRGYDQALVGLALARQQELPFVYEVRGFLEATWSPRSDLQERGEVFRRRRAQDERCMRDADLVITIAETMRDELVRRGIDAESIQVVPNVVDIQRFAPRPRSVELAEELGLEGRFVVGYVSNLSQREGVRYLIEATYQLVAAGRDVACLIVGDGPERKRLADLVVDLGLEESVQMAGHVPNDRIEDYYSQIDAFVVPRLNDQAARLVTPLKPLEAMAMQIPLVVSDLPALREIAEPGVRGLVASPGDSGSLARAITELMDDAALRDSLVAAAYHWVAADRTIEANVERYRMAIESLL